ncbi:MAG: gluconokinase [Flammeovirgaceae bacterium]
MPYLIAVDIGTTSAKALAVDAVGNVLASDQRFYPTQFGSAGEAEQNPQQIFEAVVDLIRSINVSFPSVSAEALVFSAAMHSVMAVDAAGDPLTPLLIWADTRSVEQAQSLISQASFLAQLTGTPVHPMSPLCKMMWWKQHEPVLFKSASKFISIKEFVIRKLTGLYLIDHSIASATGCFDLQYRAWSTQALAILGMEPSRLSEPASVYKQVSLTQSALDMLLLPKAVPLVLGASDGCCAQLGSDAMREGDVAITVGTSGAVRMASRHRIVPVRGQLFNFILDDEDFVFGGATNNGTALVNWFQSINANAPADLSEFVTEAATVAPGSEGLVMLPYVLGERAPVYDATARGAFIGISVAHGRLHFQRALLEGICFALKDIFEQIRQSGKVANRIVVSGGITRSTEWMQMLCNVLQQELQWLNQPDASAIGAAKIGFRALGWQWRAAAPEMHFVEPQRNLAQVFDRQFALYQRLYPALNELRTKFE